jgi:hypothetical protein
LNRMPKPPRDPRSSGSKAIPIRSLARQGEKVASTLTELAGAVGDLNEVPLEHGDGSKWPRAVSMGLRRYRRQHGCRQRRRHDVNQSAIVRR